MRLTPLTWLTHGELEHTSCPASAFDSSTRMKFGYFATSVLIVALSVFSRVCAVFSMAWEVTSHCGPRAVGNSSHDPV